MNKQMKMSSQASAASAYQYFQQIGTYRVSHIIAPTMFFVIFSGSGACTEELLTFIQQPWKFATL